MILSKWDKRFLDLAAHISTWSKDPGMKVGAVIVRDKRIISVGFNGFPKGVDDSKEDYLNRDLKLKKILHAEENAILFAKQDLTGATVYIHPCMSCSNCAAKIIQVGITRVVAPKFESTRWAESFKLTQLMFKETGVKLDLD